MELPLSIGQRFKPIASEAVVAVDMQVISKVNEMYGIPLRLQYTVYLGK